MRACSRCFGFAGGEGAGAPCGRQRGATSLCLPLSLHMHVGGMACWARCRYGSSTIQEVGPAGDEDADAESPEDGLVQAERMLSVYKESAQRRVRARLACVVVAVVRGAGRLHAGSRPGIIRQTGCLTQPCSCKLVHPPPRCRLTRLAAWRCALPRCLPRSSGASGDRRRCGASLGVD